jgi:hypothetical protein
MFCDSFKKGVLLILFSKMSENSTVFLKKFEVWNNIKEDILNKIKFLYVFKFYRNKNNNKSAFLVTNDDKVFVFDSNSKGVLGFGNNRDVNDLTMNEELNYKKIFYFKNSNYHVIESIHIITITIVNLRFNNGNKTQFIPTFILD